MSNTALAQTIEDAENARRFGEAVDPLDAHQAPDPFDARPGAPVSSDTFTPLPQPYSSTGGQGRGAQTTQPTAVAIDEPIDPERYVCGPGDLFELNFWGLQNLKLRVLVDVEGRAFVPKVGNLEISGKTLSQARRIFRDSVTRFYPRLGFDATLAQPRTFLVQVVNGVQRPGSYTARAVERVATVITRAGGFGPKASKRRVEVRRRDGTVLQADLLRYTLTGDVKHNPYLLDGDVIRVPYEELAASIDGAVNRPGRYELIGTRDLAELVEISGGLAPTATAQLPLSLVRRMPNDRQDQQLFDLGSHLELPDVQLSHEDEVRIPDFTQLQRSVMVVGAIQGAKPPSTAPSAGIGTTAPDEATATRRLAFAQGDTLRTLLERVGGVTPLADLTGSYLLRGGTSIPVDLYSLIVLRELKADRPIELGDTLVIPFKRRNILVQGAVFNPGSYPYNPTYGVEQYLALAGGRNRFARSLDDVRVVTPNGETAKYRRDLRVAPGSSVVVSERNFSRSEMVQIALGIASVLVSGVAVVLAAQK